MGIFPRFPSPPASLSHAQRALLGGFRDDAPFRTKRPHVAGRGTVYKRTMTDPRVFILERWDAGARATQKGWRFSSRVEWARCLGVGNYPCAGP